MPEAYTHIRIARAALKGGQMHKDSVCAAAYEMGANGPDPLFVSLGTNAKVLRRLGSVLHKEKCGLFLQALAHYAKTPVQRSYVLGFVSHYATDGCIHPYVHACVAKGMPFAKKGGHGYCEVAMDTLFYEADTGAKAVSPDDSAPRLSAQNLAEICLLLRRSLQDVYGETIALSQLSDAFRLFRMAHGFCCAPRVGKRMLAWVADQTAARGTDYVQSHLTPAKQPKEGFPEAWTHPVTGAQQQAGPTALCLEAARIAMRYQFALSLFWQGKLSAAQMAAALGNNSYETGCPVGTVPVEAMPPAQVQVPVEATAAGEATLVEVSPAQADAAQLAATAVAVDAAPAETALEEKIPAVQPPLTAGQESSTQPLAPAEANFAQPAQAVAAAVSTVEDALPPSLAPTLQQEADSPAAPVLREEGGEPPVC